MTPTGKQRERLILKAQSIKQSNRDLKHSIENGIGMEEVQKQAQVKERWQTLDVELAEFATMLESYDTCVDREQQERAEREDNRKIRKVAAEIITILSTLYFAYQAIAHFVMLSPTTI